MSGNRSSWSSLFELVRFVDNICLCGLRLRGYIYFVFLRAIETKVNFVNYVCSAICTRCLLINSDVNTKHLAFGGTWKYFNKICSNTFGETLQVSALSSCLRTQRDWISFVCELNLSYPLAVYSQEDVFLERRMM